MPAAAPSPQSKRAYLLIPFGVLLVLHPLLIHGPSAGQDLAFHLQSWLDAAAQLRQGTLYPHWDITAAWNAGEPRFLFYPPLSWLLGAILTLIFPINLCPTIFIAIALLLSGFAFHKLATEFASPSAALIASTLYLANPYMLFTAFERSALAELLAAAWIPLLLLALLRPIPADFPSALRTIRNIAIPLALLWLTNAPAAVIGSYTLALVATLRVLHSFISHPQSSSRLPPNDSPTPSTQPNVEAHKSPSTQPNVDAHTTPSSRPYLDAPIRPSSRPERSAVERPLYFSKTTSSPNPPTKIRYPEASASGLIPPPKKWGFSPWGMASRLALTYLASATLGLTLPALYLLPAAYERRYVQTAMALLPNMRYQDNFLFTQTADPAHNAVNHTISLLALTLLLLTAAALLTLRNRSRESLVRENPAMMSPQETVILSEGRSPQSKDPETLHATHTAAPFSTINPHLVYLLAVLTLLIAILLTPFSTPIWQHLPNLAYLQFPWRLLTLLAPILALTLALLLDQFSGTLKLSPSAQDLGAPFMPWLHRGMGGRTTALTLLLPLALAIPAYRLYHQPPDPTDDPTHLAQLFATHHGFPPTDEYTPTQADNDPLRSNNPAYWLADHPNDPAPNTTPTPVELNPNLDTDDTPIPDTQTLSTPTHHHFQLHTPAPIYLILNLRNYPNWQIATSPKPSLPTETPGENSRRPRRTDGLIAIALPAGNSIVDITWHRTLDQILGLILTTLALLALALTYRRPPSPHPWPASR